MTSRWLVAALAFVAAVADPGFAKSPSPTQSPGTLQFAPQGSVKHVRQATARFPHPMVALGDPRVPADPFTVECDAKGTSRWIDSRTWSYDFEEDLPAGVRCRFTPTCSHYGADAIRKDGALIGSLRAIWRVARCGPWTPMGTVDPA